MIGLFGVWEKRIKMFVGRKEELAKLNKFYETASARVACVYGRVGMGKTALLTEFAKDKKTIFFSAYPTTESHELALFAKAIGIKKSDDKLTLEALLDEIGRIGSKEPVLLVIDHYPNFVKADNSYDKLLHTYVTGQWLRLPIKLILCGDSYLGMEKKVYGKKALWKDVLSESVEVKGMGFYDARTFFPDASPSDSIVYYGMTGGIPAHLKKVGSDLVSTIKAIYLGEENEGHLLPEQVLSSELRELSYYNRMLSTLAQGANRVNQISASVKKPKDIVVPYMNTLMSIGFVKKENPVTEPTNRKKTRYSIVNTHDLFWYRYIVPNIELYYQRMDDELINNHILPELDSFKQTVMIDMCKEYLQLYSERHDTPFSINAIGNWWENDEEKKTSEGFDLVALGSDGEKPATVFARCYYTDRPIEIATLKALIELTKKAKHKDGDDVFYLVFSSSGFHENAMTVSSAIKNIMLIPLEDVCK